MLWSIEYYYDTYGRIINKVDTSGINLRDINPFSYRGYYQDDETGWYYLNSRYYDANTLRFITIDDVDYLGESDSTLSYNLYRFWISLCKKGSIWMDYDRSYNYSSIVFTKTIWFYQYDNIWF